MLEIDRVFGDEVPLLGDHQEEKTIDETQELSVKGFGLEPSGTDIIAQGIVSRVMEESVCEYLQRLFDAVTEPVPHAPALFDGQAVVAFQQALMGVIHPLREPASVDQTVEQGEIGELLALHHLLEIEFDVSLSPHELGIPENPQNFAVRDDPPQVLCAVEVFLHEGVRREAGSSGFGTSVQGVPIADDVDGWGGLIKARSVRDGVGQAVHPRCPAYMGELVTEKTEEWDHPLIPSHACGGIVFGEAFETVLEGDPVGSGFRPCGGDLVRQMS
ncbi:TPA: hypothetical protein ENG04_05840 [Candidatus Poribacteria bacterium]|nr:hypothetical protein [Candidatus Poribacteria bacterium]HEX29586.1 hypothetical protein [Candidatus Poribacteria bacterium]